MRTPASALIALVLVTLCVAVAPARGQAAKVPTRVFVGTYTTTSSKGIYLFDLDPSSGALTARDLAIEAEDPHFLAIHPNGRFLYAGASKAEPATPTAPPAQPTTAPARRVGIVDAFAIDPASGKLTLLNQQPSLGIGATHVAVDPSGKVLLVANYGSATIASIPIDDDGRLSPRGSMNRHTGSSIDSRRQQHAYPHSINPDPAGKFVFVPDLGADKIFAYHLDKTTAVLTPADPPSVAVPAGSGPRHFAFHPNGKFAYVINEMGGTVIAYSYVAERGALDQLQIATTLPKDFTAANTCAEVKVHPSGKFLYASNRGHDSLAIFAVDPATGLLSLRGHQTANIKTPRNFGIDPTGNWLIVANQGSDSIAEFKIDGESGDLTPVGAPISVPLPVCVKFLEAK